MESCAQSFQKMVLERFQGYFCMAKNNEMLPYMIRNGHHTHEEYMQEINYFN